ncbi:unnamed protein product [Euphydryas editha]|uniref:Uncharacterized protein n=1 Tax=Euphydryas editha TaxID=104508 RepID=A0AAU9UIW6_EUPED|nr:unnamed protein product [Euphydryas editha]
MTREVTTEPRPLVPCGATFHGFGSGLSNDRTGCAKNLQVRFRYHRRHNICTLRSVEKIVELEEEFREIGGGNDNHEIRFLPVLLPGGRQTVLKRCRVYGPRVPQ